jgi:hypothetical protein
MAEQLPPNTADPAGRRAGKSRRELFNEQMTTVADLKKKLSKEKDTVDSGLEGMEQTAQAVSEVPKSPLAGMLASKRDTGYSFEDRQREAASSESEGRPSYFDLREAYGHVRRTIRADKAKAWQDSFEKMKAKSTLGEIRNSPAKAPVQSEREYYDSMIEGHKARGEEVPAALQSIKARFDFNDKVKEFRDRGENLPPELEKQRVEMEAQNQGARRAPRTPNEKLEAMDAEKPIPTGTAHKLIKKSDGSVHVQTYRGADLVDTTPLGIKSVHHVHDVFAAPDSPTNPRNTRTSNSKLRFVPVIHRVTTYNSEGVKLNQEETPKHIDTRSGALVSTLPEQRSEDQILLDTAAYQNTKVKRGELYKAYGPGALADREAVHEQIKQGNDLAHDKVMQWMDRTHQKAVNAFFEKNGTSKHGMTKEGIIEWHGQEKMKDAEAKKAADQAKKNNQRAKEVKIHNTIVDAMGIPK